jgi:hypothetical protein
MNMKPSTVLKPLLRRRKSSSFRPARRFQTSAERSRRGFGCVVVVVANLRSFVESDVLNA